MRERGRERERERMRERERERERNRERERKKERESWKSDEDLKKTEGSGSLVEYAINLNSVKRSFHTKTQARILCQRLLPNSGGDAPFVNVYTSFQYLEKHYYACISDSIYNIW